MALLVFAAAALVLCAATLVTVHRLHRPAGQARVRVPDTVPVEWTRAWQEAGRAGERS